MLPSLSLGSSSLDQFRKNVYRPRLCLLLLLVLLSPYNTSQLTASSDANAVSTSQPAQSGWSISIIDGLVVAAPPPASELLAATAISNHDATTASSSNAAGPSPAPPTPHGKGNSQAASQQGQPAPGSLFRFPKLSWALIVDEHVLPALLPLHLLWAIRLAGMAVEDGLLRSSLLGSKSRFYSVTLPLFYLGVLGFLTLLAGQPATVAAICSRCYAWRTQLGFESSSHQPTHARTTSKSIFQADGLLPLPLLVMLETASTLVHLLSILPKVDASLISRFVPLQLRLPSPSHLPPLIELLPLPRSMKTALTEPLTNTATARYANHRRPMMPSLNATVPIADAETARPDQRPAQRGGDETNASVFASATALPQQSYRRVGAPENEVLRSTSVTRPIAPLQLPENIDTPSAPGQVSSSALRRRRAPRLRGQSVLVSTKWLAETTTALFDKVVGSLIYAVITLRLPTLSPTSLPPVLSLLSLRSELASLTKVWSRARSSVECLEFVRRRWGVQLQQGQDPYTSVRRPRATAAAGDYPWKSYEDVYCAICFEPTRTASAPREVASNRQSCKTDDGKLDEARTFEFCRLDCGHELHDVCLVSWLTAQAFCPTCHVVLSFSPRAPAPVSGQNTTMQT